MFHIIYWMDSLYNYFNDLAGMKGSFEPLSQKRCVQTVKQTDKRGANKVETFVKAG